MKQRNQTIYEFKAVVSIHFKKIDLVSRLASGRRGGGMYVH